MDKSIESVPQETMRSLVRHHWPGTFESCKTTSRWRHSLQRWHFFEPRSRKLSPLEPEISNPTLEDKVRREILAVASAQLESSEVREEQLPDSLEAHHLFYKMKRLGIAAPADIGRTESRFRSRGDGFRTLFLNATARRVRVGASFQLSRAEVAANYQVPFKHREFACSKFEISQGQSRLHLSGRIESSRCLVLTSGCPSRLVHLRIRFCAIVVRDSCDSLPGAET